MHGVPRVTFTLVWGCAAAKRLKNTGIMPLINLLVHTVWSPYSANDGLLSSPQCPTEKLQKNESIPCKLFIFSLAFWTCGTQP